MNRVLLVHYSEIGLKGRNRSFFERRFREDIRKRLYPAQVSDVRVDSGRVVARLAPQASPEAIHGAMAQVFGVAWYALAEETSWQWEEIMEKALAAAGAHKDAKTFKIYCTRADKTFPMSSQAVCIKLGDAVREKWNLKVDLDNHDLGLNVEVLTDRAYIYTEKHAGTRGLPRGTGGRLLCLFSGGIDSPVAAWMMMRRGALVHFLHFHPFRRAEEIKGSKIFGLYKVLRSFSPSSRMFLIPHYPFQVKAALEISPDYEMVLFRGFMMRTAAELARQRRMKALVMGDSLGQVASQTVENILAAEQGTHLPVFRPLIALDKEEIVKTAQKINTFDLSTQPYKDCCSLMSRHPRTKVNPEKVRLMQEKLDMEAMVKEALALVEVVAEDGSINPLKVREEAQL